MARFLVLIRPVALALTVPSLAFSQAATPAPPTEPSLRTFLPDLADDVRRLPSNPVAVSVTLGLASGLKYVTNRERADRSSHDSFPSGHAAETFASAMAAGRHLGRSAAAPDFAAARFVSFSRINQRRHHPNLTGVRTVTNIRRNS